ncbi:staphyloferrin B biosynthesis decarboxylase SbnH [Dactylosporangium siamense]|uniref:Staphyloferrin B biosynthesis decarboxylase SbnH n=1 Tax=Dactylosporangium siamense TaxID=685454 RepID=A0A919PR44_9ACTN|nr:staphyloferrin B biosynthesis decarboxylase SbnH [Dactylosporangium siamense]
MVPPHVSAAILAAERPVCAYVYDRAALHANVRALRAALPAGTRIAYAMKANGDDRVVAAVLTQVDGLEVASGGELAAAVAAGSPFTVFSGPAKTDADLRAAVAAGAVVNVESLHELRRLTVYGPARVCLRVNRSHPALPGSHAMAGVPTAFGIDEELLPEAVRLAREGGLDVAGFHLHAVSNNLDAAAHAAYIRDAVAWAGEAAGRWGVRAPIVNVGGGFGVDIAGDGRFDLEAFRDALSDLDLPDGATLVVEPGRFVAASAGWYAAEVLDVKRTHGRWFVVVRGGTHHFRLPASWGYSHPFTVLPVDAWPYPFERPQVRDATVDVAGEQCNPRDVLARDAPVTAVRAGDVLVFANTGAYGWEVAHHDFLRHAHPELIVI